MAPQVAEQDEDQFEGAGEVGSGYEHTRDRDVQDQREYRMIPTGKDCTFTVKGFELNTKRPKHYILARIGVSSPEEYADGQSDFSVRMWLGAKRGTNDDGTLKKASGLDMTLDQLTWMYAAANQVTAKAAYAALIKPVFAEFPTIGADDVQAFEEALVAQCNTELKGAEYPATSAIDPERPMIGADGKPSIGNDGKPRVFEARQNLGKFQYPKVK